MKKKKAELLQVLQESQEGGQQYKSHIKLELRVASSVCVQLIYFNVHAYSTPWYTLTPVGSELTGTGALPLDQTPSRAYFTGLDSIPGSQLRTASTTLSGSRKHSPYALPDMHHRRNGVWVEDRERHDRPLLPGLYPHSISGIGEGRYSFNGSLRSQHRDDSGWSQPYYDPPSSFARFDRYNYPASR